MVDGRTHRRQSLLEHFGIAQEIRGGKQGSANLLCRHVVRCPQPMVQVPQSLSEWTELIERPANGIEIRPKLPGQTGDLFPKCRNGIRGFQRVVEPVYSHTGSLQAIRHGQIHGTVPMGHHHDLGYSLLQHRTKQPPGPGTYCVGKPVLVSDLHQPRRIHMGDEQVVYVHWNGPGREDDLYGYGGEEADAELLVPRTWLVFSGL